MNQCEFKHSLLKASMVRRICQLRIQPVLRGCQQPSDAKIEARQYRHRMR
jgi:hypothetical protein